jgi:thymidylate synthase
MKQYLNLLQEILDNGVEKESGRENMPPTIGLSKGIIEMDLQKGFPLLTTKKMYWKGIIHELLWFLHGDTNIKYLVDNDVNIWNGDAYRWYLKAIGSLKIDKKPLTIEEFIENIKEGNLDLIGMYKYKLGDLGKVYGYQWRNQNGVDQIKDCIESLQKNPYSRYHIINAWSKADFPDMALPPCHLLYQFIIRPLTREERTALLTVDDVQINSSSANSDEMVDEYLNNAEIPKFFLDMNMYQRSCDTFLGVPFNLASMSLLLKIFARTCNMEEGVATWFGGDTHLYIDHIELAKEQIKREPYELPKLFIKKELHRLDDILALTIEDFELVGYKSHPAIKAELFTGLKK